MAIEQWEIDLRNQLLEGSEVQKEWEKKDSPSRKKKKVQTVPMSIILKKEENLSGYYIVIFLLMAMGLFVYNQKSGGSLVNWVANRIKFTESERNLPPVNVSPPANNADIARLKLDVEEMKKDMETINSKSKWNSDRISLIGMLVNENFVILGNGYNRSDLILFNYDWTINKMPKYLQIQGKDKEYLQKFVKPAQ